MKSKLCWLALVVFAILLGGILYFMSQDGSSWTSPVVTGGIVKNTVKVETENKTYQGDGFTFEYPAKYIVKNGEFFSQEQLDAVELERSKAVSNDTMDAFNLSPMGLPLFKPEFVKDYGNVLDEYLGMYELLEENIALGNYTFLRANIIGNYPHEIYYTTDFGSLFILRVYSAWEMYNDEDARNILASLKIE